MGADPFSDLSIVELGKFRDLLIELLQQNEGLAKDLGGQWSNEDQITPEMRRLISLSFEEKKTYYVTNRVIEQGTWYSRKADNCKRNNKICFFSLCGIYSMAIIMLLIRISSPSLEFLPIDLCAAIAGLIIGWVQLKKYDELASSYGLTAHEIGIIRSRIEGINDFNALSGFVADSENAFSREHTQWAARRDH
jgi:hypothetical protein